MGFRESAFYESFVELPHSPTMAVAAVASVGVDGVVDIMVLSAMQANIIRISFHNEDEKLEDLLNHLVPSVIFEMTEQTFNFNLPVSIVSCLLSDRAC